MVYVIGAQSAPHRQDIVLISGLLDGLLLPDGKEYLIQYLLWIVSFRRSRPPRKLLFLAVVRA
jgi:hypothetical protein